MVPGNESLNASSSHPEDNSVLSFRFALRSVWFWGILFPMSLLGAQSVQATNRFVPLSQVFDEDARDIPKIVEADYIDLSKIIGISKFRSAEGHDYCDSFESCRSMKHYFKPKADADWGSIKIFSPVTGVVFDTEEEWAGTKIDIQPDKYPAFLITIFHVRLSQPVRSGDRVTAGQQLGFHFGKETWSDIAVSMNTSAGRKLVSYFEAMPDSIFQEYHNRGVVSRDSAIISKETRDLDPLICRGGKFTTQGHRQNWLLLSQSR